MSLFRARNLLLPGRGANWARPVGRRLPAVAALTALAAWLALLGQPNTLPADEPAVRYPDRDHLLVLADEAGGFRPIATAAEWQPRRAHILAAMEAVMGPPPPGAVAPPLEFEVISAETLPTYVRQRIRFQLEPEERVFAWLLLPRGESAPRAAVLCLHQTTQVGKDEPAGLAGLANLHYADELATRGIVALAVDYPNFGEYACDPYARGYASATAKGLWNHRRALDLLESLPQVDRLRLGAIGHSLGGHNSLFLAAVDERVRAVVSCCGFCNFRSYYQGDLTGWSHRGYMPRIREVYGLDPRRMPFEWSEVLAAIAPRACLAVAPTGDENFALVGVTDALTAARAVYELLGAGARLQGLHPECGHDFPPEARQAAYRFLERELAPPAKIR